MSILSEFTFGEVERLLEDNPSLRGFVQGYLAEIALMKRLKLIADVKDVSKIPDKDKRKGDIVFTYKGTELTVEVKSVKTGSTREDVLHDTWEAVVSCKNSDKREIELPDGTNLSTGSILRGTFDILAISTYSVKGTWEYLYMENKYLPSKTQDDPLLIKTSFKVSPSTTPLVESNLIKVLDSARDDKLKYHV